MSWLHFVQHWLAVHLGIENEASKYYAWWSGAGGCISEVTLLGGVFLLWRKHECGVQGCHRLSRRPVAGTDHIVCHKHHPDGRKRAPTAQEVIDDHSAHKAAQKGAQHQ